MRKIGKRGSLWIGAFVLLAIMVIISAIYMVKYAFTEGSETITVKDKWVKPKGDDAKYLVSSTNNQVFQITDSWVYWRWDSSNVYDSVTIGKTYIVTTQGFRFPFLSDYKNIITLEDITN